jgi:hypothetical protein
MSHGLCLAPDVDILAPLDVPLNFIYHIIVIKNAKPT